MSDRDEAAFVQLKFRIREGLRAVMDRAAKQRGISMNAEITLRLEQSLEIDRIRAELEVERQQTRDYVKDFAARETEYQKRINQLTDYAFQLTDRERLLTDRLLQLTAARPEESK